MPRLPTTGLLCLLCLLSAACAPTIHAVQVYQASFVCDGGQLLQVQFAPFKATLEAQGVSVDMIQQPTAEGFLYAGDGQSLHQRGSAAIWTDAKGTVHNCGDLNVGGPMSNLTGR